MAKMKVEFFYDANPEHYPEGATPEEMANIDQESIDTGELDAAELLNIGDAYETIRITPAE